MSAPACVLGSDPADPSCIRSSFGYGPPIRCRRVPREVLGLPRSGSRRSRYLARIGPFYSSISAKDKAWLMIRHKKNFCGQNGPSRAGPTLVTVSAFQNYLFSWRFSSGFDVSHGSSTRRPVPTEPHPTLAQHHPEEWAELEECLRSPIPGFQSLTVKPRGAKEPSLRHGAKKEHPATERLQTSRAAHCDGYAGPRFAFRPCARSRSDSLLFPATSGFPTCHNRVRQVGTGV